MDPEPMIEQPTAAAAGAIAEKPLVLDAREAARLLGISRSTFLKLHAAGKTPMPVRFGRAVRWRRDDLKAWLDAGAPSRAKWLELNKGKPGRTS
jgi:excisionase family DNA binding protein